MSCSHERERQLAQDLRNKWADFQQAVCNARSAGISVLLQSNRDHIYSGAIDPSELSVKQMTWTLTL